MNGLDLKKRREKLGLTQENLAEIIGISRKTINSYENGANIPLAKVTLLEMILSEKETKSYKSKSDVRLKNFEEEIETYINKNGIKFYLNPDDTTTIEVLKVPFKAYASYLEVFNDEEKLNDEFTKVTFKVDKIGKGNYLAFDSENDSMWNEGGYDTPSGAEILARELGRHLWNDGFRDSKYGFILVTHKGIFHKDIKEYNKENGNLTLASRNPTVKEFEISINDVRQIFKVIKRTF